MSRRGYCLQKQNWFTGLDSPRGGVVVDSNDNIYIFSYVKSIANGTALTGLQLTMEVTTILGY